MSAWHRIVALLRKDTALAVRDWELAIFVFGPVLALAAIAMVMNMLEADPPQSRIAVVDPDALVVGALEADPLIEITQAQAWEDAEAAIDEVHIAIDVPPGFIAAARQGQSPTLQVLQNSERIVHVETAMQRLKPTLAALSGVKPPIRYATRGTDSASLAPRARVLQTCLLIQILMICVLLLPMSVGEEKESGCLEALVLSPAHMREIIAAKVLFSGGVSLAASAIMIAIFAEHVVNVPLVAAFVTAGALCFSAIGVAVALSARSRKHGNLLGSMTLLVLLLPTSIAEFSSESVDWLMAFPSHWLAQGLRATPGRPHGLYLGLLVLTALAAALLALRALRRHEGARE